MFGSTVPVIPIAFAGAAPVWAEGVVAVLPDEESLPPPQPEDISRAALNPVESIRYAPREKWRFNEQENNRMSALRKKTPLCLIRMGMSRDAPRIETLRYTGMCKLSLSAPPC